MICALTARRIAAGKTDEFIEQFSRMGQDAPPPEIREKFKAVYACRDVEDPNVILTFGLFDGSIGEFREIIGGEMRDEQLEAVDPMVEEVLFDRSFEVLNEFVSEFNAGAAV